MSNRADNVLSRQEKLEEHKKTTLKKDEQPKNLSSGRIVNVAELVLENGTRHQLFDRHLLHE